MEVPKQSFTRGATDSEPRKNFTSKPGEDQTTEHTMRGIIARLHNKKHEQPFSRDEEDQVE
jgi:hypothetical protein